METPQAKAEKESGRRRLSMLSQMVEAETSAESGRDGKDSPDSFAVSDMGLQDECVNSLAL